MPRKQLKKKWTLAAVLVLTAALIPAEASTPNLTESQISACRQKAMNGSSVTDDTDSAFLDLGTCSPGSPACCGGAPEAECAMAGGGGGRLQPI
jgi:hypothetical protein